MDIELLEQLVDYGIIGLLALMSFISLWLYIERLFFYKKINLQNYKTIEQLEIDISNNIATIASFASNSVYIGLLGTVFGIIITFYSMGQTGQIDVKIIMGSLALALKATAMGLIVAIPSMFFYNHLVRKIEVLTTKWSLIQKERSAT